MIKSLQYRVVPLDNARFKGVQRSRDDIQIIVMHNTAGASARSSIDWMNRPEGQPLSYHYIIDRDGMIYRMTPPEYVAYHAGASKEPGSNSTTNSVNSVSLGIAFANKNDGEDLTSEQLESGLWLCSVFVGEGKIPVDRVYGHSEVSPGRKTDIEPAMAINDFRAKLKEYVSQ